MDFKKELITHAENTGYLDMNLIKHVQMLKASFRNTKFQRGELTGGVLVLKHMIMHQLHQSPKVEYLELSKGHRDSGIKALADLERTLRNTQDAKAINADLSIIATAATYLDVPAVASYKGTPYWQAMDDYQAMAQSVADHIGFGYTPQNLRKLLKEHNLTVIAAADLIGVSPNNFHRYLKEPDSPLFSTMQHHRWLKLLEEVGKL